MKINPTENQKIERNISRIKTIKNVIETQELNASQLASFNKELDRRNAELNKIKEILKGAN